MSEEIELAAKTTGEVVGALIEASGVTASMQELTGWLANWLHPRLVASAAKQMMNAVDKLQRAGVKPGAVRDERMRQLLEHGAREEDEGLKERWANLLAQGLADGDEVPRAYVTLLRQLEPIEAQMLDGMADEKFTVLGSESGTRISPPPATMLPLSALENLERLDLIRLGRPASAATQIEARGLSPEAQLKLMQLTPFAVRFVEACRAPEPPG